MGFSRQRGDPLFFRSIAAPRTKLRKAFGGLCYFLERIVDQFSEQRPACKHAFHHLRTQEQNASEGVDHLASQSAECAMRATMRLI